MVGVPEPDMTEPVLEPVPNRIGYREGHGYAEQPGQDFDAEYLRDVPGLIFPLDQSPEELRC